MPTPPETKKFRGRNIIRANRLIFRKFIKFFRILCLTNV